MHNPPVERGTSLTAVGRYTAKNKDEPGTEEKIKDLTDFISRSKFGMMTTRTKDSHLLVSRCMAVAGSVRLPLKELLHTSHD